MPPSGRFVSLSGRCVLTEFKTCPGKTKISLFWHRQETFPSSRLVGLSRTRRAIPAGLNRIIYWKSRPDGDLNIPVLTLFLIPWPFSLSLVPCILILIPSTLQCVSWLGKKKPASSWSRKGTAFLEVMMEGSAIEYLLRTVVSGCFIFFKKYFYFFNRSGGWKKYHLFWTNGKVRCIYRQ